VKLNLECPQSEALEFSDGIEIGFVVTVIVIERPIVALDFIARPLGDRLAMAEPGQRR
jgi:hypothetical protein